MSLTVLDPGLLSSIQSAPRRGGRRYGIATGGAADPLSLALANKLCGNEVFAPAIEATMTGLTVRFETEAVFAVTGAPARTTLNGEPCPCHATMGARPGDVLVIGPAEAGCRTYLAIGGGLAAEEAFGSRSTDLRTGRGGHHGRALEEGDCLSTLQGSSGPLTETPEALRPPIIGTVTLRAVPGPEAGLLSEESVRALFGEGLKASLEADRTGVRLKGMTARLDAPSTLASRPVFPGTVQCPQGGAPLLLLPDAGTTGGYPRAAQVIRADRHLLGQIRPGAPLRFLEWPAAEADEVLREKASLLEEWLGSADVLY